MSELRDFQGEITKAIYDRARVVNTGQTFPSFEEQPSRVRTDYFELADAALDVVERELGGAA